MRIIKELSEHISEDIKAAKCYAKDALEYKTSRPEIADIYYKMAKLDFENAMALHDHAQRIVGELERSGKTYPPQMMEAWEEKHKKAMAKMAEAKTFIDMYR